MGSLSNPPPVKLIAGMLSSRRNWLDQAARRMEEHFNPVDLCSEVMDFPFTHYYDRQMGGPLLRQFVAFARLVAPDALGEIKRTTNAIEEEFSAASGGTPARPVNLDPGYVSEGKLVLASTKDFAHRIYLGGGVFAEVTLTFRGGRWVAGRHTFPDFASGRYDGFLTQAREALRRQLGRPGDGDD